MTKVKEMKPHIVEDNKNHNQFDTDPFFNSLMHNVPKWSGTLKILQHLLQDF